MERLTFKLGNSYGLEDKASSKVGLFTDYDGFYAYLVSTNRLGAYEDTGLTPEEIITIHKENAELKELLKLAFEDIRGIVIGMEECELCKNNDVGENIKYCHKHDFDCKNCEVLKDCKCGQCKGTNNWQWQHADKLKELGVE